MRTGRGGPDRSARTPSLDTNISRIRPEAGDGRAGQRIAILCKPHGSGAGTSPHRRSSERTDERLLLQITVRHCERTFNDPKAAAGLNPKKAAARERGLAKAG